VSKNRAGQPWVKPGHDDKSESDSASLQPHFFPRTPVRFATTASYGQFVAAVDRAQIRFYRGSPSFYTKRDYMAAERLLLPLARNGADVDLLLGITVTMRKQPEGPSRQPRRRF